MEGHCPVERSCLDPHATMGELAARPLDLPRRIGRWHVRGEIGVAADVLAVAGASGRWAVWGQRSWELALVWSADGDAWLRDTVPFASPLQALRDFAGYGTWGTRLEDRDAMKFVERADAFGKH